MTAVQLPAMTSQVGFPTANQLRGGDDEQVPSSRLFTVLWRRKWLIVLVVLAAAPPAALLIYRMPAYYDAQASLAINTRKASFRDLQATVEAMDSDAVAIGTQVTIIRSPAMALRVVDRLDLTRNAEFRPSGKPPALSRLWARIGARFGVTPAAPAPALGIDDLRQFAALQLGRAVTVQNDGHSYIINIQARSGAAPLSAAIANAFADIYLDFNRQLKIAAIRRANLLLDDEMAPMRARLRQADEAVESYRQSHGLVTGRAEVAGAQPGGASTVSEAQLAQINAQLISARDELATRQASLHEIQSALRAGQVDSIPEVVGSPLISTLRAQQTELSSKVASLSQTALPGNPALREAMAGSADVARRINTEVAKIASSVASQAQAAASRVATLQGALSRLQGTVAGESRADVTLRQLEGEASAARNVYQDYLGRFEHTSSDSALQEPEADIVSPAMVPLGKSGPPRGQLLALALAGSLGLGSLLALVMDRLRQGVRSTEQLETATGLYGLGLVPVAAGGVRRQAEQVTTSAYTGAIGQVTNLLRFGNEQVRAQAVLITSAAPREGKTALAISLAANVGRGGGRALLIDCDLRRPSVARELRLPLSPRMAADQPGKALLHKAVLPGLDVLTFSASINQWSPGLAETLSALIQDARARYDLIVLDTPPVLAFADAPLLSLQADGVVMAVRWRHTPVAAVAGAMHTLTAYGVRVIGGVITQVKLRELDTAESGQAHLYRAHAQYFR